jgi:hypothetical protein
MSLPIDPFRGTSGIRMTSKAARRAAAEAKRTEAANVPAVVEPAAEPIPPGARSPGGDTAIRAQVGGERRGLRAGPQVHDEARGAYNSIEWSGSKDRRRPKGGTTKTKV